MPPREINHGDAFNRTRGYQQARSSRLIFCGIGYNRLMGKDLKSFCDSAGMYTRIKNALWAAKYDWPIIPPHDWEPKPRDFLRLNPKTIVNIGPKSLEILRAWVAANK